MDAQPHVTPSRTPRRRAEYARRYAQAYKLKEAGIISPYKVKHIEPDSHCGFQIYDVSAQRAPMFGWITLGDGCYWADAKVERACWMHIVLEQDESSFGLMWL